jgi:hypothetical protein
VKTKGGSTASVISESKYSKRFADVIKICKKSLLGMGGVADVAVSQVENSGWRIDLKPRGSYNTSQIRNLSSIAMEALLQATTRSKYSIFVMGYSSPQPFLIKPHGFEATLGAMEGAGAACWHIYKKGFCRHGDACSKQHPLEMVNVEVVVDSARLDTSEEQAELFQQQMCHVVQEVLAKMRQCSLLKEVVAIKDEDRQSWVIEAKPKQDMVNGKDSVIAFAREAIFSSTGRPQTPCIMGYAVRPFLSQPGGFVTILADVPDKQRACWRHYSEGYCPKATPCGCQWDHSTCSMLLTLVVKEN